DLVERRGPKSLGERRGDVGKREGERVGRHGSGAAKARVAILPRHPGRRDRHRLRLLDCCPHEPPRMNRSFFDAAATVLIDKFNVEADRALPDATLEHLGLDSLALM